MIISLLICKGFYSKNLYLSLLTRETNSNSFQPPVLSNPFPRDNNKLKLKV